MERLNRRIYDCKNRQSEEKMQEEMQKAIHYSEEEIDLVGPHLFQEEIIKALESMKQGKADGF